MAFRAGRRQVLIGGATAAIAPLLPLKTGATPLIFPSFLKPFPVSRTITAFCWPLLAFSETMPDDLRRRLEAMTDMMDDVVEFAGASEAERMRAERISMIAVRVFASRALRRAGYHHHAAECEVAADLESAGRAASVAQHTIGRAHRGTWMTGAAGTAYGAAAHAANAIIAARSPENRWVPDAGERAASALLAFEEHQRLDAAEKSWIWRAAAASTASCLSINA